jgi:hypothetical protein
MRIAILSWESLHSIQVGGVSVHVTELAAALERKGYEIHVFTRMGHNQPCYERIDGVHYHRCPFALNPSFVDEIDNNLDQARPGAQERVDDSLHRIRPLRQPVSE